jgi:hypothetical protein
MLHSGSALLDIADLDDGYEVIYGRCGRRQHLPAWIGVRLGIEVAAARALGQIALEHPK